MSWTDYQTNQIPDLPARSDDLRAERQAADSRDPEGPVDDFEQLAERLHLPVPWFEELDWLIRDRRAIVLTGPPGSGKTYVARALAEHYAPERNRFLQFHPSYAYEDFVEGYRPTTDEDGALRYEISPGPLREAIDAATGSPDLHIMVIDEINRANLSKVLGELFFALEYRGEPVALQYSGNPLVLPVNLLFIGTMNTADRSIASFDAALRRRFHFVACDPTEPPFDGLLTRFFIRAGLGDMEWLARLLRIANDRIPDPSYSIGPSHFMREGITYEEAARIWKHSVWPYLLSRFDEESIADLRWEDLYGTVSGAVPSDQPGSEDAESDAIDA